MNVASFLLVPLAVGWAAWSARADDRPGKGVAELQGVWRLTAVEANGKSREPFGGGEPRWVVRGETISYGGEMLGKIAADPATRPRLFDLKLREPEREYEGIYAVEKDTLRVCLNRRDGAKDRPDALATRDQPDRLLLVFEKEKAPPARPTDGLTGYVGVALRTGDGGAVVVDPPIAKGPSETAGLKKDDVILKVGATAAEDLEMTVNAVRAARPGTKLDILVQRDGKEHTITVPVGVLPFHYVVGLE
jgi:uncharacterized protein (TIGR03067 family)